MVQQVDHIALVEEVGSEALTAIWRIEPLHTRDSTTMEKYQRFVLSDAPSRRQLLHIELIRGDVSTGVVIVDPPASDIENVTLKCGL